MRKNTLDIEVLRAVKEIFWKKGLYVGQEIYALHNGCYKCSHQKCKITYIDFTCTIKDMWIPEQTVIEKLNISINSGSADMTADITIGCSDGFTYCMEDIGTCLFQTRQAAMEGCQKSRKD